MDLEKRFRQLDQGVRCLGVVILLFAGFLFLRVAMQADEMERIFAEMLGDKPLPLATQISIRYQSFFVLLALLVPLGGTAAAWFCKSPRCALFSISAGVVVCLALGLMMFAAFYAPMAFIVSEMNSQ